ncbi:hypothetical protein [Magnetospirillum moscoviense]|uniref:hypothetical protein n=1 Tax=Magnetospirillum moscoviense TaxID=1437059 RepID=UPI0012E8F177|nr:hypothetical protein [Magnetospirillum moscoviense]
MEHDVANAWITLVRVEVPFVPPSAVPLSKPSIECFHGFLGAEFDYAGDDGELRMVYGFPVDAFSINPAEIRHFSQFYEPSSVPGRRPAAAISAFLRLCRDTTFR